MRIPPLRKRSSLPECCLSAGRDRLRPVRGVLEIAGQEGKAMRIPQLRKRSSLLECCLSAGRDRLRPVRGVFTGLLNIRQAGLFW